MFCALEGEKCFDTIVEVILERMFFAFNVDITRFGPPP